MSVSHSTAPQIGAIKAPADSALDIEDFIRLYYGEVDVDDFVNLYNTRKDLQRIANRNSLRKDEYPPIESGSSKGPSGRIRKLRPRAATYQDDDSGFFSANISANDSPRRRSMDSDLREQLSKLAIDLRLNIAPRTKSPFQPHSAAEYADIGRLRERSQAESSSLSSFSRETQAALTGVTSRNSEYVDRESSAAKHTSHDEQYTIRPDPVEEVSVASKIAQTTSPERDLIVPAVPSGIDPLERVPLHWENEVIDEHDSPSANSQANVEVDEKQFPVLPTNPPNARDGFLQRSKARLFATYAPRVDAALVLPSAPTDKEKYGYLHTNRLPLYAVGVFSFLSLSAGMWLFVLSSVYFSWFGVFCGLLQTYLFISYTVGLIGRDFDFENHKKVTAENPIMPETCPTVDIYLPCCKEPLEILRNTYEHVLKLEYPVGKLKVYVLDDGAMDSVKELAESFGFEYIRRDDRPRLKKAGNLRWAFARTYGDFFNIYDADFCPRSDFLLELLPMALADDKVAIVQSPQFFRTLKTQTWIEQGAGAVQELFYRVVQVNRDRWGASICVGSNAIYRRAALVEVGGTAEIGFSEDVHTGFGCVDRGWKVKYNPLCLACGVCPDTPRAFFSQQMRWCMGSTTLLSNPEFWRSRLTIGQKICYMSGMMYYSAVSLGIFVNPLPGIFLLWLRPEYVKYYNLAFAVPSLFFTLITFRLWARADFSLNAQFCMVIQSYAYFTAIKDKIFGKALAWAPSGDSKAHKNHKYRNMRIMAWCWFFTWEGALIAGVTYRIIGGMPWWNTFPLLLLDTFNFYLAHRFLFCQA